MAPDGLGSRLRMDSVWPYYWVVPQGRLQALPMPETLVEMHARGHRYDDDYGNVQAQPICKELRDTEL